MIDEIPTNCAFCCKPTLFPIYDRDNNLYICAKCCTKYGHQPPFTAAELVNIRTEILTRCPCRDED